MGDPTADEIWELARERREGISRTEVSDLFSHDKKARELDRALGALVECGRLERVTSDQAGRSKVLWRPVGETAAA